MHKWIFVVTVFFPVIHLHAQQGVNAPGKYIGKEFSAGDCFNRAKYRAGIRSDSISHNKALQGQRIWRVISLDDRENKNTFTNNRGCAQVGLFEVIKFGLLDLHLNAFNSDDFNDVAHTRIVQSELVKRLRYKDSSEVVTFDADGNEKKEIVNVNRYYLGTDISCYLVKEDWVMNSATGKMMKYIVGIAPLVDDPKTGKVLPLFWLYYPEWKELFNCFVTQTAYDDEPVSYGKVFTGRRFISQVSKESNVYDRSVRSVNRGADIIEESEFIREKLNRREADNFGH